VPGDEPGFVVASGELDKRSLQLFDGIEGFLNYFDLFVFEGQFKKGNYAVCHELGGDTRQLHSGTRPTSATCAICDSSNVGAARFGRRKIPPARDRRADLFSANAPMRRCAMAKAYKYKGILAKPIGSGLWLKAALSKGDARDAAVEEAARSDLSKVTERVEALCDNFGIPRYAPNVWALLAMALAERHVPGFSRTDPKKRRPKPKSILDHAPMVRLIDERVAGGQKVSPAVNAVAKQLRLKTKETVERDYRRFKAWDAMVMKSVEKIRQK